MARRIPSLNGLRVFDAAARAGSFAGAAETLIMSPPAVGQQIRALEDHLGRALSERGPQSVMLTEAGCAYLPAVAQALHGIESTTADLFGEPGRSSLVVTCSLMLASGWLAPRLPAFQRAHPGIRLTVRTAIRDQDFHVGGADLRITFGLPPGAYEDSDPLFGERLAPVAPPEIAAQVGTARDLADHPLIEIATHRANWSSILPTGSTPSGFSYTDNTLTAFVMAAGGAVALDRQPATGDLARRYGLVPCPPGLSIPGVQSYALVGPARTALSRPARVFRDWLLAEAATSGAEDRAGVLFSGGVVFQ